MKDQYKSSEEVGTVDEISNTQNFSSFITIFIAEQRSQSTPALPELLKHKILTVAIRYKIAVIAVLSAVSAAKSNIMTKF